MDMLEIKTIYCKSNIDFSSKFLEGYTGGYILKEGRGTQRLKCCDNNKNEEVNPTANVVNKYLVLLFCKQLILHDQRQILSNCSSKRVCKQYDVLKHCDCQKCRLFLF